MKRNVTKARMNDIESRYSVIYESDDCEAGTMESRKTQHAMLRAVVDNPGMMDCGPAVFQKLKMFHDGQKWVIELEAVAA